MPSSWALKRRAPYSILAPTGKYLWGPHGHRRRGHHTQSWYQQASICGVLMGAEEEGTVLNPGTNRQVSVGSSWALKRRAPYSILAPTGKYLWGPHGHRRRGHHTQSWYQQASICGVLMGAEEEGTVLNPGTNRQVSVGSSWVPKRRAQYSILAPTGKYLWGPHGRRRGGHSTQSWHQQASICGVLMSAEEEGTALNPGTNRQVSSSTKLKINI